MILRSRLSALVPLMWLLITFPSVSIAESIAEIKQFDSTYSEEASRYEFTLLSIAGLSNLTIDGFKVSELSGLAWDEDENLLYTLSDNGYLLHLRPVFKNNKLADVLFLKGYALRDNNNRTLRYKESDSEGLNVKNGNNGIQGDSRLIVCFERIPRLIEYKTDGSMIAGIPLPSELADIRNYQGENNSLEAVTINEKFGIITGPEHPLISQPARNTLDIYSLDGRHWSFPVHNEHYGALVGMTTMPDGSVLVLERAYGGIFPATEITLHHILLGEDRSEINTIYTFDSNAGLLNENFEGITRFRGDTYFMVNDDNNHPFKRTMLVFFSIKKKQVK